MNSETLPDIDDGQVLRAEKGNLSRKSSSTEASRSLFTTECPFTANSCSELMLNFWDMSGGSEPLARVVPGTSTFTTRSAAFEQFGLTVLRHIARGASGNIKLAERLSRRRKGSVGDPGQDPTGQVRDSTDLLNDPTDLLRGSTDLLKGSTGQLDESIHVEAVAIKIIDKWALLSKARTSGQCPRRSVVAELEVLRRLSKSTHKPQNTLRLVCAFQSTRELFIVTEYCERGDVCQYIRSQVKARRHRALGSEETRHVFVVEPRLLSAWVGQLADALSAVHELGYAHRDVRVENLFLAADLSLKLGDFGSAIRLDQAAEEHSRLDVDLEDDDGFAEFDAMLGIPLSVTAGLYTAPEGSVTPDPSVTREPAEVGENSELGQNPELGQNHGLGVKPDHCLAPELDLSLPASEAKIIEVSGSSIPEDLIANDWVQVGRVIHECVRGERIDDDSIVLTNLKEALSTHSESCSRSWTILELASRLLATRITSRSSNPSISALFDLVSCPQELVSSPQDGETENLRPGNQWAGSTSSIFIDTSCSDLSPSSDPLGHAPALDPEIAELLRYRSDNALISPASACSFNCLTSPVLSRMDSSPSITDMHDPLTVFEFDMEEW